jgi:hypothetical protein|tara:strand:+ start:1358 stop:1633 length:276 start_codon:yes stop_codon:yes gene_type:complete
MDTINMNSKMQEMMDWNRNHIRNIEKGIILEDRFGVLYDVVAQRISNGINDFVLIRLRDGRQVVVDYKEMKQYLADKELEVYLTLDEIESQ